MDGVIIVDKKEGETSFDVVRNIRKKYNEKKVGHIGTLDPLASGVLPVLIGKATKLSAILMEHDKDYVAKIVLGKKTSTGDREGEVIDEKNVNESFITESNVKNVLESFLGESFQVPPMYSAIKVNGKKLYELAREGKEIERAKRKIYISKIELIKINKKNINNNETSDNYADSNEQNNNDCSLSLNYNENSKNKNNDDCNTYEITFKVTCSKGTYIRALCEDIASKLGTVGYMSYLRRTRVGDFKIEDAGKFIEMENIINDIPKVEISENEIKKILNGVKVKKENLSDGLCKLYYNNSFIGFGEIKQEMVKRKIMI